MKYAIIESGGKQYRAVEGTTVAVDLLPVEAGESIELDKVLLLANEGSVAVGTPTVAGAVVKATVVENFKGPKLIVFKYKAKERYRRKTGHRQPYTRLKIEEIIGG